MEEVVQVFLTKPRTGTFHMPVLTLINITHAIWQEMLDSFLSGIFIMWVCGRVCALAPVWRSEDNLLEFSLLPCGFCDGTHQAWLTESHCLLGEMLNY